MIVGRWYVQLSAIWHWYLPLSSYITFFKFCIMFIHSFLTLFFNRVSINQTEWLTITACPSLMRSLNGGNTERTNGLKIHV